ncbi:MULTISPECIES: hypothetical protein [unclassified Mesorhizobium]|uniref:hypothetical protein n=1 Tax=unclassified Mesorhizobium TaxID=325217 RepID=UPI0003CE353F|nr:MULTISPECIES: hypothetical protein [unclassified Mesorhizobium]ESY45913.1 hypothetical protein X745_31510 [Mesorhizobium sp. LNJC374B00]ESY51445.1 hypothetical protein X744_31205 [Mesorhizobium sp. LNJC372A00]WJI79424.1 hypothetical protein NLY34_21440 [Mesorhizobium sp. C374B]WJI85959.1 hypothetical protein NLY42_23835 [Mesorhizobium sp. C372A]
MNFKIAKDSTIATIWDLLKEPLVCVGGVRQKLSVCVAQHGNAEATLGVTGRGYQPCFRITYEEGGSKHIFGSFWDNHQPLDREDALTKIGRRRR